MTNRLWAAALAAAFATAAVAGPRAEIIEQIIVKVNGDIITKTEFEQRQVMALRARKLDAAPQSDADLPGYFARLGLPGVVDVHVHFMPEPVLRKVWSYFDLVTEAGPVPWPVRYRFDERFDERLREGRDNRVAISPQ